MLKVATIGIGNAGNQITDLAMSTYGIPGIAINSSEKDLVNVSSKVMKILIGNKIGSGKNRDDAKEFIKRYIGDFFSSDQIRSFIEEQDVIFVISSIGGGTGSGSTPMLTELLTRKYTEKKFILVQVYPTIGEAVASQQNAIDYLGEVHKFMPDATYVPYDNNRKAELSSPEMLKSINNEIVEMMNVIKGEYLYDTPYNSIDECDMLRFVETPGRMAIYMLNNIKEKDFDDKSIEDEMINMIKNVSTSVELDRDKIVKRLGIITNLNEKLNKMFDTNIPKIKELIGEPVESYEHTYICKSNDEVNRVILIAAGLSEPDDRINKMIQRIEEGLAALNRVKEHAILDDTSTDAIREMRQGKEKKADLDMDDIFSKFIR